MIAINFIDKDIVPLQSHQTIQQALDLLDDQQLTELPIVDGTEYVGIISEAELHNEPVKSKAIKTLIPAIKNSVDQQTHFFDIWTQLVESHLGLTAVCNKEGEYIGCIKTQNIVQFYNQTFALTEPGCIIILNQRKLDYSLARIASIVEEHDSVVLSSFVSETSDPESILITIKLNRSESQAIVLALRRYEIQVVNVYSEELFSDPMNERYNLLMSYLNV
jgi:acetoin utilization protein AcuB